MKRFFSTLAKVVCSLLVASAILWWMYRDIEWKEVWNALYLESRGEWMLLSLPFGILAQLFRALRWRQVLRPLGERPRLTTCVYAVFLSYASSLVIPRAGEVLRCAVMRRWDGVGFTRSFGTVVAERAVDMIVILLLAVAVICSQIPFFVRFVSSTGMSFAGVLHRFTAAGYVVTAVCVMLIVVTMIYLWRRMNVFSKTRDVAHDFLDGMLSLRMVNNCWLFAFYTLGIWVAYFLHFYLAFFCFPFTRGLGVQVALVAFVVGTFAVLVPTPNGAGPWHFAVKTVLVHYGVDATQGAMFALIVHAVQTLLVILLGLCSLFTLFFSARRCGNLVG